MTWNHAFTHEKYGVALAIDIDAAVVLTTARLRLTPLAVADAQEMHPVLAEPQLYQFTGGTAPSLEQLERRFALQCAGSQELGVLWRNWIIRLLDDGQAVGFVQATVTGNRAAIAWLVGLPWQQRGIATEATSAMCAWLAAQGVERLVAHINPEHHASASVARAVGLTPTEEFDADAERIWSSPR